MCVDVCKKIMYTLIKNDFLKTFYVIYFQCTRKVQAMTRMTSRNTWRIAEYKKWCEDGFPRTPIVKHLMLRDTGIKYLSLFISRLPNLETVDVSRNKLTVLPYTLWALQHLEHLDISHNQIQSLNIPKSVSPLLSAKYIADDLGTYQLFGDIRQEMPFANDNKTQTGPSYDGGPLGHPLNRLWVFRSLFANDNLIREVPNLESCVLRFVDFSNNLITKFPKLCCAVLVHLSIHGNKINSAFSSNILTKPGAWASIDESMTDSRWLSIEWGTATSMSVVVPNSNQIVRVHKSM